MRRLGGSSSVSPESAARQVIKIEMSSMANNVLRGESFTYLPLLGCSQTWGRWGAAPQVSFFPSSGSICAELLPGQGRSTGTPCCIHRWGLNGQLSLCSGVNSSNFRGSDNSPCREKTRGSGSCCCGWDLKRSLLEKQMQEAPLSKNSRRPKGSLLKSCWEVFLNQKRQHNMLMLQHNCVGYQLKKHLEPASCCNLDTKCQRSRVWFSHPLYISFRDSDILSMPH